MQQAAKRSKKAKLAGAVTDVDGRPIVGPNVPWAERRHRSRRDRRWGTCWSPVQISRRLQLVFPDDESMRADPEGKWIGSQTWPDDDHEPDGSLREPQQRRSLMSKSTHLI